MPSAGPALGSAAEGAAQGAVLGSAFGPVGTAVGAVVGGVVGAVKGIFSSKSASKARAARRAQEEARLIQTFLERRKLIQGYAKARSQALAIGLASGAGVESSGIQGSLGSLQTQTESNLNQNAQQITLERNASKLYSKSAKYASNAQVIDNIQDAAGAVASIIPQGTGYSASAQRMGTGSYQGVGSVPLSAPPVSVNTSVFGGT